MKFIYFQLSEFKSDFERNSEKMGRLSDVNENIFKKVWQLNVKKGDDTR